MGTLVTREKSPVMLSAFSAFVSARFMILQQGANVW
jgi:hypothetical protein